MVLFCFLILSDVGVVPVCKAVFGLAAGGFTEQEISAPNPATTGQIDHLLLAKSCHHDNN